MSLSQCLRMEDGFVGCFADPCVAMLEYQIGGNSLKRKEVTITAASVLCSQSRINGEFVG